MDSLSLSHISTLRLDDRNSIALHTRTLTLPSGSSLHSFLVPPRADFSAGRSLTVIHSGAASHIRSLFFLVFFSTTQVDIFIQKEEYQRPRISGVIWYPPAIHPLDERYQVLVERSVCDGIELVYSTSTITNSTRTRYSKPEPEQLKHYTGLTRRAVRPYFQGFGPRSFCVRLIYPTILCDYLGRHI